MFDKNDEDGAENFGGISKLIGGFVSHSRGVDLRDPTASDGDPTFRGDRKTAQENECVSFAPLWS
jgi:hypothetical protein